MVIKLSSTEKGIRLTDSNGKDLKRVLPNEVKSKIQKQKAQQYKQTYETIKNQIIAHDVISFDIFDTLITRRVSEPEMVFDLVGRLANHQGIRIKDFRRERIKAQLESGLSNANLDEIYDQLEKNIHISKEQADLLKQAELKCEKQVILLRQDMVKLFYFALESRKKVYLTTDMYLERRHIVSLLNACAITGYYDILVSCEYRKLKLEGLFDDLKAMNPGKSILHIGDNYIHDCICAEAAYVDSLLIPKSIEIAKKKREISPDQFKSMTDKIMLGCLVAHVYNSPFEIQCKKSKSTESNTEVSDEKSESQNKQKAQNNKRQILYNIGYSYLGPIVLSFVGWMIKTISLNKYDGILLSARDGYLLDKVFSILKERKKIGEKAEIHYFYISRKAAVSMHTDEEAIINMLIDRTDQLYTPDKMLREVFCIDEQKIEAFDSNTYYNKELFNEIKYKYVWNQYNAIKENVYQLKRNFYRYLGNERLHIGGKYLFYDFVSSGTIQRALSSIVPFEMDGVYYQFKGNKDFKGSIFSRFPGEDQGINENYKMLENLLLSPEPSLWSFDQNGRAIFCAEQRSVLLIEALNEIHQGALAFVNEFLNSFEISDAIISDELTYNLIREMSEQMGRTRLKEEIIDDWLMGISQKQKKKTTYFPLKTER